MRSLHQKWYGLLITVVVCLLYIGLMKILSWQIEAKYIFLANLFITPFSSSLSGFTHSWFKLQDEDSRTQHPTAVLMCDIFAGILWGSGWVLIQNYYVLTE